MKNLLLIRHAKSNWDIPNSDFDRGLTDNGIKKSTKCAKLAAFLINDNSLIWSSAAVRAYETSKIFIKCWDLPLHRIEKKLELYTFSAFELEQIVKSCPNECENLILFGHNCAITDFVNKFGDNFIDNVPTSGLVSINFETDDWKKITKGHIIKILFPRDI
jgi:phosphohistidine phosphatase